jgi:selenide,water dikinase
VLRPLKQIFREQQFPDLLVGLGSPDDGAVYRVSDELAFIFTLDFFTPVVDDPYTYGAVAAANAMSDVYAMGGKVLLALSIAAFPPQLPAEAVSEILRGAADKVAEAGGVIAGGHTIDDKEPKFGLAVVGSVHPGRVVRKGGARPGDVLLLTKPLGSGLITTAAKGDAADPADLQAAIESMLRLNRRAAELAQQVDLHAMTDVTGFSLLGHGCEMAEQSQASLHFRVDSLPFLPGVSRYAGEWLFPGGTFNNQRAYGAQVVLHGPGDEMKALLFTPETSGGLLMALPPAEAEQLEGLLRAAGEPVWRVGDVVEGAGLQVWGAGQ